MIKIDRYIKETIQEILKEGSKDKNPRPKDSKGNPAYSRFLTQKVFNYDISKGEFPITTLRKTALKGAFYDIEAIYLKQTNIIEEMHPSIHSWWKDFSENMGGFYSIGQTYGHTVRRFDLMNKLLDGLENNPFSRRHKLNLWQEQEKIDDPEALEPCAGMTKWSVRDTENIRYMDLTLIQRSMDFMMTSSINPTQYVMLGMMVCNHSTFKTGILHKLGNFTHIVQNCHIYDVHINAAKEILKREPINEQPLIKLNCEPKDFYSHSVDDFEFKLPKGIQKLKNKLELVV